MSFLAAARSWSSTAVMALGLVTGGLANSRVSWSADEVPATSATDRRQRALEQELAKVVEVLTKDRDATNKRTLAAFDTAEKKIGLLKLSPDDELKLLEIFRQEKTRFEQHSLLPFSAPMRPTTLAYLRERAVADAKADASFAKLQLKYERMEEADLVEMVKAARDAALQPIVIARWRHRTGANPEGTVECLSDGCIGTAGSPNKWTLTAAGRFQLHWPNAGAPGGVWIDNSQLQPDGLEYKGQNQDRSAALGRYLVP